MSEKPMTIRVLNPNKNNDVKLNDKTGNIDLHLALRLENGNHILTVGSRIDNEWVPMKLHTPNKWWDRLYFIPKRFQIDKIKDRKNKKSVVHSRYQVGEKKNSGWWDRLSRVPQRRKIQKQDEKKEEGIKASRYLLKDDGSEDAWWNRLSKQPWIQAEAQRAKFLALRGATMQQDDAEIPSCNCVTETKENSQHIALSDDINNDNILKNDDNKINEQSYINEEGIDYEISTKEGGLSSIISKKLSEDSQPTIDQFKNELLPISSEKSFNVLENTNNENEIRYSNDDGENIVKSNKTEVTNLNENDLLTIKKLSVNLESTSIDENLSNENSSNKLQSINLNNENDLLSISSENLTNDSISTTELINNQYSPKIINKNLSIIDENKLENSIFTNNIDELNQNNSLLSLSSEMLTSVDLQPAKDLIETVLELSDVSSETTDIDPNIKDVTTTLEETAVILSDSQEHTDNEENKVEEKSNP